MVGHRDYKILLPVEHLARIPMVGRTDYKILPPVELLAYTPMVGHTDYKILRPVEYLAHIPMVGHTDGAGFAAHLVGILLTAEYMDCTTQASYSELGFPSNQIVGSARTPGWPLL
jgi:hypothetical protein